MYVADLGAGHFLSNNLVDTYFQRTKYCLYTNQYERKQKKLQFLHFNKQLQF